MISYKEKQWLEEIESFANRLRLATRKTDKAKIICEAKDDFHKEYFLYFLLEPKIITGLSAAKINKILPEDKLNGTFRSFSEVCAYLIKHNTGRDEDIALAQKYMADAGEEHKNFLTAFFTKNLPLGVEGKTVNKILGSNLISDWQVQQAYLIEKYPPDPKDWISISQKLNGVHCSFYRGEMISRQGTEFTGLDHIKNEIYKVISTAGSWFLDGELIRKNTDNKSDSENFQITTGLANAKEADKTELEYVIYDMLPADEFEHGESKESYGKRLLTLLRLNDAIRSNHCQNIRIVPIFYSGYDHSQIDKCLDYAVEQDMEGVMVNLDTPYRCKRHRGILKVKRFYTMDLPVIAIEEGQNRLAGTLGALVVDYKGNEVRVGSGFDDAQRKEIWSNHDKYIGALAEVKYKSITSDKSTGKESLQFPVFQMFRFDKNDISYD